MLTGAACGLVNGLLVTRLKLPPFIVTLGTWSIFGALNLRYSRSETIRQQDMRGRAPFLQFTGKRSIQIRRSTSWRRRLHLRLDPHARCSRSSSGTC